MKDQVCTIEQMEALKALGVDISSASMCYYRHDGINEELIVTKTTHSVMEEFHRFYTPTFTVADMLNLMPNEIELNSYSFQLQIEKVSSVHYSCRYYSYNTDHGVYGNITESLKDSIYLTLIEIIKLGKL